MTDRPWLAHYPTGVSPELEAVPYRNLPELLHRASTAHADAIAFTQCMPNGMNGSLRYRDVDAQSDAFAAYLREVVGLKAGDRVAVQMPNCLAYPIVAFGVLKAGCVLVNTNPMYTPSEMIHQFSDSGATVLVVIDMFADRVPGRSVGGRGPNLEGDTRDHAVINQRRAFGNGAAALEMG